MRGGVHGWGVGAVAAELAELATAAELGESGDGREADREPNGVLIGMGATKETLAGLLTGTSCWSATQLWKLSVGILRPLVNQTDASCVCAHCG